MRHHMRGRHKMFHSSPAPNRPIGERISDGLSRVVRALFWLGLSLTALVALSSVTQSVKLPNGAVLGKRPDLTYTERIDLFRPNGFRSVIRAVDQVCFNDKAIWASTMDYQAYIWPSPDADPVPRSDKRYHQVVAQTGLIDADDRCTGYYKRDMAALTFLAGICPVIPDPEWQKRRFAEAHDYFCEPVPPWLPPLNVGGNAKP